MLFIGGDSISLKFSENDFNFKMSNQTDFIRSITVGLIFIPYHFICDLARKSVFLRREKIEAWLLGSVCFSGAISILTLLYYFFIGKIYIFEGKFPLAVPVISTAILFLIYALFKESTFKLYDDLQDFVCLDSILADAINEADAIDVTADISDVEGMQKITDDDVKVPDANTLDDTSDTNSDSGSADVSINPSSSDTQQESSIEDPAIASLQAAMQQSNTEVIKDASTLQSNAASATVETLSKSAKQSLYKNKMLAALRNKLEAVRSENNLSKDELNKVCSEQQFIKDTDFTTMSLNIDIDELLFGE
jgi:hypothetical protein